MSADPTISLDLVWRPEYSHALVESAPDVIARFDRQFRHLYVNPAAERVTGIAREAFIGRTNEELGMPADLVQLWHRELATVFEKGEVRAMEFEFPSTRGVVRFHSILTPELDADGVVNSAFCITRNISERGDDQAETGFRALAESLPLIVWYAAPDGEVQYYNSVWEKYTGTRREVGHGSGWAPALHPEDREATIAAWRDAVLHETEYQIEHRLRRWDGAYRWFLSRGIPQRDETGRIIRWVGCAADIHDQKTAEEDLALARSRFDAALRNTAIMTWGQDRELRYTWVHNAPPGFREPEILGRTDREVLGDSDYTAAVHRIKETVLATGRIFRGEVRLAMEDGVHIFSLTVDPLMDANGAPSGVTCAAVDITEQKALERDLRKAEEQLRMAVEGARLGTWELDLRDGRVHWSSRTREILGVDESFVPSIESFLEFVHSGDRGRIATAMSDAMEGKNDGRFLQRFRVGGGSGETWVLSRGRAFFEGPGDPQRCTRFLGVVADITEDQRRETDLQEALSAREQIVQIVSHDLRTPLQSIRLVQQLMEMGPETPLDSQTREILQRAVEQATRLVDDLLDISRIEAGVFRIESRPISAEKVLERACANLRGIAADGGIRLHCGSGIPERVRVIADEARLQQVFANLVANAVRHSERGSTIRLESLLEDGEVRFSVVDEGEGIDPELVPRIFERFRQGGGRRGRAGLGLTISRGIVEAHGGRIWCENGPDRGAAFRFTIPLDPKS